ncbi:MAG: XdhC/CoxI family protein [Ignavibacteriales bacterium]|nr:XdhC/CoxI family protein [Ignavibacteriales bacterium]
MSRTFYRSLADAEEHRSPVWLATVIAVEGSTPVEPGMKMSVFPDGSIDGTIGGGEIERRVIDRILQEKPCVMARWKYDLGMQHLDALPTGMVCGGFQEILVEPLFSGSPLTIFGAGHCGIALSEMASRAGFLVTVFDDRPEWANAQRHPCAAQIVCAPFGQASDLLRFDQDTFIVVMTHGHKYDEMAVRHCLGRPYKFLGLLGSGKKVRQVFDRLSADGYDESVLRTVTAPVGFDIGSHTPDEIAVSILAQMIAIKYGKTEIPFRMNPLSA